MHPVTTRIGLNCIEVAQVRKLPTHKPLVRPRRRMHRYAPSNPIVPNPIAPGQMSNRLPRRQRRNPQSHALVIEPTLKQRILNDDPINSLRNRPRICNHLIPSVHTLRTRMGTTARALRSHHSGTHQRSVRASQSVTGVDQIEGDYAKP